MTLTCSWPREVVVGWGEVEGVEESEGLAVWVRRRWGRGDAWAREGGRDEAVEFMGGCGSSVGCGGRGIVDDEGAEVPVVVGVLVIVVDDDKGTGCVLADADATAATAGIVRKLAEIFLSISHVWLSSWPIVRYLGPACIL